MKMRLLSVGTKSPAWVRSGFEEYARRLPPEMPLQLTEITAPKHRGSADQFVHAEGEKMLAQITDNDWVVAMDERGRCVSSHQLAQRMEQWRMQRQNIVFMVGGSDGLAQAAKERANEQLSLSGLTLPHYMVRVILAEALYRAWTICSGHPYHRA